MGSQKQKLTRRLGAAVIAVVALVATSYFAALGATTGWPTYQHDAARSGLDPDEAPVTTLSASWNTQLPDKMYAQPLVVGTLVYAATEANTVYALDVATGVIQWQQQLAPAVRVSQLPCGNIDPYGITGTPVIDVANDVLYTAALVFSPIPPQTTPSVHHELYALNLKAGGAVLYHFGIDANGSDPLAQGQRGALTLANNKVYVPFAGRAGDCGNYTGRVVGVNTGDSTGATKVSYTLPGTSRGGIWAAASADASGNVYVATGNSNATGSTPDRGESVVRLSSTLQEQDFFTAPEWANLNASDTDIGSIGPILVKNGWILQSGKNGMGYLLNSASLGHVGGQLFEARVCDPGQEAIAFGAYLAPNTVFIPCTSALKAVHLDPNGAASFTVTTVRSGYSGGQGSSPPILAGGVLWNLDVGHKLLLGFDPTAGTQLFSQGLAGTPSNFAGPSAGAGRVFVPAGTILEAFNIASGSATPTPTSTATATPTRTAVSTPTNTPASTATGTATSTPMPGATATSTPSSTATATPTRTAITAATSTLTATATSTPVATGGKPALVQSAVLDTSGAIAAIGYPNAVASGDLLIVALRIGNRAGATTITDNNANSWQLVDRRADNGNVNGEALELWYAANASGAPNARPTLSITSNLSASLRVVMAEYSGVLTSGALDQHATAIGASATALANSGMTAQANELVIGYGEVENTATFAAGAGYTMVAAVPSGGQKLAVAQLMASSAGAQTASFGISSQAWGMGVATFRGAGGVTPATSTATAMPAATMTATPTSTAIAAASSTSTSTLTATPTATLTAVPTATGTATTMPAATATPTATPTARSAPPALVQSAVLDGSGSTGTIGYPNVVASGDLLIAAVRIGNNTGATTITDNNANAWQLVDRRADTGGFGGEVLELWYAPNASSAPNTRPTLTIRSTVSASLRVVVAEYSGVQKSSTALDQHVTAIGSGATATASSGMTSQASELVLGYGEVENTTTFAVGAGYSLVAVVPSGGQKLALEQLVTSGAGAQTASLGVSSQAWGMGVATFRSVP